MSTKDSFVSKGAPGVGVRTMGFEGSIPEHPAPASQSGLSRLTDQNIKFSNSSFIVVILNIHNE